MPNKEETGKNAATGALAGAAAGAATAAGATAIINAIPGIGQVAYLTSILAGAGIGAVSGAIAAPGNLSDVITTGPEPDPNIKKIGKHTYIKVPTVRPLYKGYTTIKSEPTVRSKVQSKYSTYKPNINTLSEQWVTINDTDTTTKPPAFADYNSTTQINDPLDALSKTIYESTHDAEGNFDFFKSMGLVGAFNTTKNFFDATLWDLDGEGNSLFQNVLYNPIEQAIKGEITVDTMFTALGINALGSVGQTLDVVANPVKGLLKEGAEGFAKAFGLVKNGERTNYSIDTGFLVSDILLEIALDPVNWFTLGGKAIAGSVTKGVGKNVAETVTEKASKVVLKNVAKESMPQVRKVAQKRVTKSLSKVLTRDLGSAVQDAVKVSRDTLTESVKKGTIKSFDDADVYAKATSKLTETIAPKIMKNTVKDLMKKGMALTLDAIKEVEEFTKTWVQEVVSGKLTKQIHDAFGGKAIKLSKVLTGVDDSITSFSLTAGTLGIAPTVKYTLIKAKAPKLIQKIPGKVKGGIAGGVIGGIVGSAIGGVPGAVIGATAGAGSAVATAIIVNGATIRTLLKGIPKGSELYKAVSEGRVPLKNYKELVEEYDEIFESFLTVIDPKEVLKNPRLKEKITWYSTYTTEGLNPLQMYTARQLYEDLSVLEALHKDAEKNAGMVKSAWAKYIKDTHNLSVEDYNSAIGEINGFENGLFSSAIAKQQLISTELNMSILEELMVSTNVNEKSTAEGPSRISEFFEAANKEQDIKNLYRDEQHNRLSISEDENYFRLVKSPVKMLSEYIKAFKDILDKHPEILEEKSKGIISIVQTLRDLETLELYINTIKKHITINGDKFNQHEILVLEDALIKSFWDLRTLPKGTAGETMVHEWLARFSEYARYAKKYQKSGTTTVSDNVLFLELREPMEELVTLFNKEDTLQRSLSSLDEVHSNINLLYNINRLINYNQSKEFLIELRTALTEVYGKKFLINDNHHYFKSNADVFKEMQDTSTLSNWLRMQRALGADYELEQFIQPELFQKFYDINLKNGYNENAMIGLTSLLKNAQVASASISNLKLLEEGSVLRKELDAFWEILYEQSSNSIDNLTGALFAGNQLTAADKYSFVYALAQHASYGKYVKELYNLYIPYFQMFKKGQFPNLMSALSNPDALGFKFFKPGVSDQVIKVSTTYEDIGLASSSALQAIHEINGEGTAQSLQSTLLRREKKYTVSNPAYTNILEDNIETIGSVQATANYLGQRMQEHLADPNNQSVSIFQARAEQGASCWGGKPNPYFDREDEEIMAEFLMFGNTPSPDVMRDIFSKLDAYEQDRFEINRIVDTYIPDPRARTRLRAYLGSTSESVPEHLKGYYVSRYSGESLASKKTTKIISNVIKGSDLPQTNKNLLTALLHNKAPSNRFIFFKNLKDILGEESSEYEVIKRVIDDELGKFSIGDSLRYYVTKFDNLSTEELDDYISIIKHLREEFGLLAIPAELLPNSFKHLFVQKRLSAWGGLATTPVKGAQESFEESIGYAVNVSGASSIRNQKLTEVNEAYLEKFFEAFPDGLISTMDSVLFKSILQTLPDDSIFWNKMQGFERVINNKYGDYYQAVYITNYYEAFSREQINISDEFNFNNSAVRKATLIDLFAGDFKHKLNADFYKTKLMEQGVTGLKLEADPIATANLNKAISEIESEIDSLKQTEDYWTVKEYSKNRKPTTSKALREDLKKFKAEKTELEKKSQKHLIDLETELDKIKNQGSELINAKKEDIDNRLKTIKEDVDEFKKQLDIETADAERDYLLIKNKKSTTSMEAEKALNDYQKVIDINAARYEDRISFMQTKLKEIYQEYEAFMKSINNNALELQAIYDKSIADLAYLEQEIKARTYTPGYANTLMLQRKDDVTKQIAEVEERLKTKTEELRILSERNKEVTLLSSDEFDIDPEYMQIVRHAQTALVDSMDMQNTPILLKSMHDGPTLNIKTPIRGAEKYMQDVNGAFDAQNISDIQTRFMQEPKDLLLDIAGRGGYVVVPYSKVKDMEYVKDYFIPGSNNRFSKSKYYKNMVHVIVDEQQDTAMIVVNLNLIEHLETDGIDKIYFNYNNNRLEFIEQQITRDYSDLKSKDPTLWSHVKAITEPQNDKAYGHLWQRDGWGSTGQMDSTDFFNVIFNGYSVDDRAAMVGRLTAGGSRRVDYWSGFNLSDNDRNVLKQFGWLDNDNKFNESFYRNSCGNYGANNGLMGHARFIERFYPDHARTFIESFNRQVNTIVAQTKTQVEWIEELYETNMSLNALLNSGLSEDELVDELNMRYREAFIGTIVYDSKTKTGMRLVEIPVHSKKDLRFAIKHKAIVMLRTDAYSTIKYLNNPLKHSAVWNFISRVMYLFKYGWLSLNPGTLMRNWLDTELKTSIELKGDSAFYKHYAGTILSEFEVIVREMMLKKGKPFITKKDIKKFFNRIDLKELNIKNLDESLFYKVYDLIHNGPMSNLIQEDYSRAMLRSSDVGVDLSYKSYNPITNTVENFSNELDETRWEKFIGFLQDKNPIVHLNNKIENTNRLALFLESIDNRGIKNVDYTNKLGFSKSGLAKETAYSRIRAVHFDYNNRTPGFKKLETLFPFLGWTLDNIRYWLDIIDSKPWLVRNYFNANAPIWSLHDYTPEQIEQSVALQQQIIKSNIPLLGPGGLLDPDTPDERTYMLKINPSFADAFAGISNPIGVLRERKNSVLEAASEALVEGLIPYESWLERDMENNPRFYFQAGVETSTVEDTLAKYASLIPIAGTIYNRVYNAKRQATEPNPVINAAGAVTGVAGITSHVQLAPTDTYQSAYKYYNNRPDRVRALKYKNAIGLRPRVSTPRLSVNPLPKKNPHAIYLKGIARPGKTLYTDKLKSRKLASKIYGINVAAFR